MGRWFARFVCFVALLITCLSQEVNASESSFELQFENRKLEFADLHKDYLATSSQIYVHSQRALVRTQIEAAKNSGLRYLGVVANRSYAFVITEPSGNWLQFLRNQENLTHYAFAEDIDRLEGELLEHYFARLALPHPLVVTFWPNARVHEVLELVPDAAKLNRIPTDLDAVLGEEHVLHIGGDTSTIFNLDLLAREPIVASIGFDHPKVAFNDASRSQSNANALAQAPYNLDGEGVLVGHWDGGRVGEHSDFDDRVDNLESGSVSSHATHTAGTVLGSGNRRGSDRGFAPKARMVAYSFYGNATAERRTSKHQHYHEHDNHSWGADSSSFGGYSQRAKTFDLDTRDLLMLGVKSAGNDGRRNEVVDENYGFYSLSTDSTCKNMLVVGATQDNGDLAGFSSRGPTNDGRIKPDLSANGNNLTSTLPNNRYGTMSGTSMSAPSVTGMIVLLSQLFKRIHTGRRWAPDMIRTVLIHTVNDVFHEGPDYRHGWGNANAQAAADLLLADSNAPGHRLLRGAVRDGTTLAYPMDIPEGAPELKVTMSWLDAFSDSTAQRRLINDLDLELESPSGETFYPWTLDPNNPFDDAVKTQANRRDNVEQVLVKLPQAGTWTIKIKGTSVTDPGLPVQGFVIASSHHVGRAFERLKPQEFSFTRLDIPDNDTNGVELTFVSRDPREVVGLRLHIDVNHEERGDLRIDLIHPDGTSVMLEENDSSTRRDIYAIYPDLRSWDEDVLSLYNKPALGTWKVRVSDRDAGVSGGIISAMLELDFEGIAPPPPNQAPTANAGKDQTLRPGDIGQLDGRGSTDPDGDALSFQWSQDSGTQILLTETSTSFLEFTVPDSEGRSELIFRLKVTDARGASTSDTVKIIVIGEAGGPANRDPRIKLEYPRYVKPGQDFTIDATASTDPDGDPLTFRWLQTSGIELDLLETTTSKIDLIAPEEEGPIGIRVEADDGRGGLDIADVQLTISSTLTEDLIPEALIFDGQIKSHCACQHSSAAQSRFDLFYVLMLALSSHLLLRLRRRQR